MNISIRPPMTREGFLEVKSRMEARLARAEEITQAPRLVRVTTLMPGRSKTYAKESL